ncbi:MAG: hypothetical protein HZA94_02740 [Candidatus Vogelbacteria bacterium]|nr:hypothetical protein [Candidatus Vogelbacteria bacterium]
MNISTHYKKIITTFLLFVIVGGTTLYTLTVPQRVSADGGNWAIAGAAVGSLACLIPAVGWITCGAIMAGTALVGWGGGAVVAQAAMTVADSTLGGAIYLFFFLIFKVLGLVFWLSSYLLDYFIKFGLSSPPLDTSAIQAGWIVTRDISNIFFIFILLYISITTIIGKNGPNTYKLLGQVIAAALLINFSLAIGRTVIDSSNILANEFWSKVSSPTSSLSTKILAAANLTDIITTNPPPEIAGKNDGSFTQQAIMYMLLDIFILLALIVIIFGAFLFLLRFISLSIILVLAPVAFIGSIIPQTEPYAKEWWQKLFQQSFVAPAFLFFIYLALYILSSQIIMDPGATNMATAIVAMINGTAPTNPLVIAVFIKYALAMGFLVGAVIAAQKLGGTTAKLATAAAGSALGLGAAGMASAGRATVGKYAASVAKTFEGEKGGISGAIAGSADYLSKASLDIRNAKVPDVVPIIGGSQVGQKISGGISQATGIKIDAGTDTGFAQEQAKETETRKKKEIEEKKVADRLQNESDLEAARAMPTATPVQVSARNTAIQAALKKFSPEDILKMKSEILADVNGMLANLDAKGVKALEEKGELTSAEKATMRTAIEGNAGNSSGNKHYKDIRAEEKATANKAAAQTLTVQINAANAPGGGGNAAIEALLAGADADIVSELDTNILTNTLVARNLSEDHLEALVKAGKDKLKSSQRRAIKQAVMANAMNVNGQNYLNSGPGKKFWG